MGQQETFLWNIKIFMYKYIYILSFENIEIKESEKNARLRLLRLLRPLRLLIPCQMLILLGATLDFSAKNQQK